MKKSKLLIYTATLLISSSVACAVEIISDLKKAREIDHLIEKRLLKKSIKTPQLASDHVFLRRAFLTAIGRIPTEQEASSFSDLSTPRSRQQVIDYLYEHEGYDSHMSNWAMDLLRLRDRVGGNLEASALTEWVRGAIREDKPWDQVAHELLTSKGNAWANNGASGFFAMDPNMQNDNLSATVFAFLGVKMECSQCHDDPTQEWERMDFYELSAFVNGVDNLRKNLTNSAREMAEKNPEKYDVKGVGQLRGLNQFLNKYNRFGIPQKKGSGDVKLPKDWQYEDGHPGDKVYAKTPFGMKSKVQVPNWKKLEQFNSANYGALSKDEVKMKRAVIQKEIQEQKKQFKAVKGKGLHLFGDWVISDETPQFAYTVSARMWERVMGFSLTDTLGQYEEVAESKYPLIWEYIAQLMKEYDYDLKRFQKTLASTKAFQAVKTTCNVKPSDEALAGRPLARLSAEQLWDSLLVMVTDDPEKLPKRELRTSLHYKGFDLGPIKETMAKIETMSQEEYSDYVLALYDDMVNGKVPKVKKKGKSKSYQNLRRSSELTSPISKDHFLYTFGQSGRSVTDGSTREGSVSQALLLYNGEVQKHIVHNKNAALNRKLATLSSPEEKIRSIFQTVLTRQPSGMELAACLQEVAETKSKAYLNITSALISSKEFLFLL